MKVHLPEQRTPANIKPCSAMKDIKCAAAEVLFIGVAGADHLGGLVQTGTRERLQVRVENRQDAQGPAIAVATA